MRIWGSKALLLARGPNNIHEYTTNEELLQFVLSQAESGRLSGSDPSKRVDAFPAEFILRAGAYPSNLNSRTHVPR